jgi:outer membrane protein assembly factor BamD (BamD/ComL family)
MKKSNTLLTCLCLLLFFACAGSAKPEVEDLSAAEYFQKAYKAIDNKKFSKAIRYYQEFQLKYPDDLDRNLWAEYEIAFVKYKMGEVNEAAKLIDELLSKYADEDSKAWPEAPKFLAEALKAKIAE